VGKVYLAQDARLERAVAIRILPDEFFSDVQRTARFDPRRSCWHRGIGQHPEKERHRRH
jgi:hypothetical protein